MYVVKIFTKYYGFFIIFYYCFVRIAYKEYATSAKTFEKLTHPQEQNK